MSTLDGLQGLVIPLVGVGIVLVVGFLIISEAQTQVADTYPCANTSMIYNSTGTCCRHVGASCNAGGGLSYSFNGTRDTQTAMSDIPAWLPIIVITVIGALLLGLVAHFRSR